MTNKIPTKEQHEILAIQAMLLNCPDSMNCFMNWSGHVNKLDITVDSADNTYSNDKKIKTFFKESVWIDNGNYEFNESSPLKELRKIRKELNQLFFDELSSLALSGVV